MVRVAALINHTRHRVALCVQNAERCAAVAALIILDAVLDPADY